MTAGEAAVKRAQALSGTSPLKPLDQPDGISGPASLG